MTPTAGGDNTPFLLVAEESRWEPSMTREGLWRSAVTLASTAPGCPSGVPNGGPERALDAWRNWLGARSRDADIRYADEFHSQSQNTQPGSCMHEKTGRPRRGISKSAAQRPTHFFGPLAS